MEEISEAIEKMERDAERDDEKKNLYQCVVWYKMQCHETLRNEYSTLKIHGYDTTKENYIERTELGYTVVLNAYKNVYTKPKDGRQERITFVGELADMIGRLIKARREEGLTDLFVKPEARNAFKAHEFSEYMINTFKRYMGGKIIGSNMLRKIAITERFEGVPTLKELERLNQGNLNSGNVKQLFYNKPKSSK
jgi:hypothetical protein